MIKNRDWTFGENKPNQSQFTRAECCVLRAAKGKLKKQSQFIGGQIALNSYLKGYYDKITTYEARKNKPKQSQFVRIAYCVLLGSLPLGILWTYGLRIAS